MNAEGDTGAPTDFGFSWGPMQVTRIARVQLAAKREHRIVGVKTKRSEVNLYVSRTGLIRVFREGKELK